jgi:hypothetical protein
MNPSKLYVPNPQKWMNYFARVAGGKVLQTGRGRQMLTMDSSARGNETQIPVKVVMPSEQTVAQAVSELHRDNINPKPIRSTQQKQKRKRRRRTSKKGTVKKHKRRRATVSKKNKQTGGGRRASKKQNRKLSKADILGF